MRDGSHQNNIHSASSTHHSPPEGISIAAKVSATVITDVVLLCEVDKIRREYESKETNVERCDQLLLTAVTSMLSC